MTPAARTRLLEILARQEKAVLDQWLRLQSDALSRRRDLISDEDLARDSAAFLSAFRAAAGAGADIRAAEWAEVREHLGELSTRRARLGFSPAETASFVFSLKQPLFHRLRDELASLRPKSRRSKACAPWSSPRRSSRP